MLCFSVILIVFIPAEQKRGHVQNAHITTDYAHTRAKINIITMQTFHQTIN